jgi:hypothetical protein
MQKKKDSLFFNNLENESVNMNPTSSLGFNPFEHKLDNDDNDFDILNLEEDKDEEIDEPTEQTQVVEKVKEVVIETPEDVLKNIKDIIKQSITQQIGVESEEFNFDDQYQLIIRVSKNKEQ